MFGISVGTSLWTSAGISTGASLPAFTGRTSNMAAIPLRRRCFNAFPFVFPGALEEGLSFAPVGLDPVDDPILADQEE